MRWIRNSLAAALLLCIGFSAETEAEERGDNAPLRLPDFKLEELTGETFDSAVRLRNHTAVITCWRVDHEPSIRILKELQQLNEETSNQEVMIVGIASGPVEGSRIKRIRDELGIGILILLDPDRRVFRELEGIVSPSTWFVDRRGDVFDSYPGHRRDFLRVARGNIEFLRGRIGLAERTERIRTPQRAEVDQDFAGPETRYRLALRLLEKGQRRAAIDQLERAWESDPPLVIAGTKLGLLLLKDERDARALEVLDDAAKLAPDNLLVSGARGVALMRVGQEEAGVALLRRALQHPTSEPLLYYEMAKHSERSGELDDARRYYRTGFELMLEEQSRR